MYGIACRGAETNRSNNNNDNNNNIGNDRTPLNNRFSELDFADNSNNNNEYYVKSNKTANGVFRSVLHNLYHGVLQADA